MMDSKKEIITLPEVCELLSISLATGRNWIKSGILNEINELEGSFFYFTDIVKIKEDIQNDKLNRLNKRRNKRFVKGKSIPKKYLQDKNALNFVQKLIDLVPEELNDKDIAIIIAEFALRLFNPKIKNLFNNYEYKILNLDLLKEEYQFYRMVNTFIIDSDVNNSYISEFINNNSEIFNFEVPHLNEDVLGLLYMSLKSLTNRKSSGIYYTPTNIVNNMVDSLVDNLDVLNSKIIDPCVGTGNFLIEFVKRGFNYRFIFGRDIDIVSVFITRTNIILFASLEDSEVKIVENNIKASNSLFLIDEDEKYDVCIGNPPWGSQFDDESLQYISNNFEIYTKNGLEAFSLFIEVGSKIVKNNGYLSYIVPEAFFNVQTHENIRKLIMNAMTLISARYWGNAFDGVLAPAVSFILFNQQSSNFANNSIITTSEGNVHTINDSRDISSKIWDFKVSNLQNEIIVKIDNLDNCLFLKDNADFALGIVTGDNKEHLKDTRLDESYSEIVKGSDVFKFRLGIPSNYIKYQPEKYQQVAKNNLYFANEKLIYRFISDKLVFAYDNSRTLSLNSANIVVPKLENVDIKYVLAILNSKVSHFVFKSKFNSIKILRNHIESIPIRIANDNLYEMVINIVNRLIDLEEQSQIDHLYDELNRVIYDIYDLTENEITIIESSCSGNNFLY